MFKLYKQFEGLFFKVSDKGLPMNKLVKITLFLTALSSSVFSSPNELTYEKVISSSEKISYVEPILDVDNKLSGIVYTDSALNKFIIDYTYIDSVVQIAVPSNPLRTIARYSDSRDTLILYTLSLIPGNRPQITITKIYEQAYTQETITVPTYVGYSGYPYSTNLIEHFDFRFYPNAKTPEQIIFEFNFRVNDYVITMGQENYNVPTSIIYNLDISEIIQRTQHTTVHPAYLYSKETQNYIFSDKNYYSWNFVDIDSPNDYGMYSSNSLSIYNMQNIMTSQLSASYNDLFSIHVDNFAPSSAADELIIHANSVDLLEYYGKNNYLACYSFADGTPTELWYNNNVTDIDFSFVYHTKDLLVGIRDLQEIIMLNYLNGQISDSSLLDSKLSHIQFFESGLEQPLLNLVGMSGDTVKVYQFDIATNITEPSLQEELPQTFTLFQNHPNPFNGETRLEFTTTKNQYLKLSVFNILGQEIKILAASRFASGTYSFYWNGYDDHGVSQATGIYFARLESKSSSQMIKLIYLK